MEEPGSGGERLEASLGQLTDPDDGMAPSATARKRARQREREKERRLGAYYKRAAHQSTQSSGYEAPVDGMGWPRNVEKSAQLPGLVGGWLGGAKLRSLSRVEIGLSVC